jgi:hypothetical protein
MRANGERPARALARAIVAPMEWPSANHGGRQNGSRTCSTRASRSRSNARKSPIWPLRGFFASRPERPCPRQSRIATSKFRLSNSPMTSKYFSMNSARPGKIAIVPAQACPQLQRAARRFQLSRAAMAETTAPGGAGFSKIVQSSIAKFRCSRARPAGNFNRRRPLMRDTLPGEFSAVFPLLQSQTLSPHQCCAGRFRTRKRRRALGAARKSLANCHAPLGKRGWYNNFSRFIQGG